MQVEPFDLDGIIQKVTANNFMVREEAGNINIRQLFACSFPGILFISPVRLGGTIPEEKRHITFYVFHEIFKVLKVVYRSYPLCGPLIAGFAGNIADIAVGYPTGIGGTPQ